MSIADEWKEWVRQRETWHSEEELEREVSDIRQLEADFAEAMRIIRAATSSRSSFDLTNTLNEAVGFLARLNTADDVAGENDRGGASGIVDAEVASR